MNYGWTRNVFWVGVIVVIVLAFQLLSSILLPFVLGAIFAFFLDPVVGRMRKYNVPRAIGALLVMIGFILILVVIVLLLVPLLETQITQLVQRFPSYLDLARRELDHLLRFAQHQLAPDDYQRLRDAANQKISELVGGIGAVITGVLTGGMAVANLLSLIFITPIVTFFLLRDWDLMMATIDGWMPRQHVETIREQAQLIEETLSGFVRGQAAVCLLFSVFYAAGLSLLGIDFGLVIGFCVGFLIFIPFLGGLAGAVIAAGFAFAQFHDWHQPLYVLLLFAIGQSLEGNIVTPKLVGDRVHLHPVWIIFSLLAFGALFGFAGVVIAVPAAAVLGVLIRFALKTYLRSPLYAPPALTPEEPSGW